jgi:hypothetical protein
MGISTLMSFCILLVRSVIVSGPHFDSHMFLPSKATDTLIMALNDLFSDAIKNFEYMESDCKMIAK